MPLLVTFSGDIRKMGSQKFIPELGIRSTHLNQLEDSAYEEWVIKIEHVLLSKHAWALVQKSQKPHTQLLTTKYLEKSTLL